MKLLTTSFDIYSWRQRMEFTQQAAADALGISLAAYRKLEYVALDRPRFPVKKSYAVLARLLEREEHVQALVDACRKIVQSDGKGVGGVLPAIAAAIDGIDRRGARRAA
jgi:predicted transcriptional regulator